MSWLKGAIDKVKEKGAAVKVLARDVVHKGKEMKARLTGAVTAKELERTLESKAMTVNSCRDFSEMCRWLSLQMDDSRYGYPESAPEGERYLSFSQIVLRSRCIESLLERALCIPVIREEIHRAWTTVRDENEQSDAGAVAALFLYQMLKRVLEASEAEWYNSVTLVFSEELPLEAGKDMIGLMSRTMKRDWYEDFLSADRVDLEHELEATTDRKSLSDLSDIWEKIDKSSELVDMIELVRDNLDTMTSHRAENFQSVSEFLTILKDECTKKIAEMKESQTVSVSKESEIRSQKGTSDTALGTRLDGISSRRSLIDGKLFVLESERKRLKLELDRVSIEIEECLRDQRECMVEEESTRDDIIASKNDFEELIQFEKQNQDSTTNLIEFSDREIATIDLIRSRMTERYQDKSTRLESVYNSISTKFIESVQEHVTLLSESVQESYRRVKRTRDELVVATSALEYSIRGENEEEESLEDRSQELTTMKINSCRSALVEEAHTASRLEMSAETFLAKFDSKLNANRLLKGEVDKLRIILQETQKLLQSSLAQPVASVKTAGPPTLVTLEEDIIHKE